MAAIGDTFQHKHIKTMTCEITDTTNKGFKVSQSDTTVKRGKAVTKFYEALWFDKDRGVWEPKK